MAKGKGKELAMLNKPPQEGASPPAVPTGTNPSPPSSTAAVDPAQGVVKSLRQQNNARHVAANSQHPQQTIPPGGQQQLPQALKPNAPPHFKQHLPTSIPTQAQKLQAQQQEHAQRQIQAQQRQQQQGSMAVPQSNISSANNNNIQPKVMLQQSTQRPDYADARLSTSDIKSTSADKNSSHSTTTPVPLIGEKLQKLCNSIDPSYKLDADVQERLLEMADSFVEKVTKDAIKLSKHRGSKSMDVIDVALALKKGYNMSVPGLGPQSVAGNTDGGGKVMGGWLFADKVNASREAGPASKKQKTG